MFLTLCHVVSALGWVPSTTFMFACAPQCFLVWLTWRVVSLPLPARVYERGDELFYTLYQSMVVFFFENASGVEFVFHGDRLPEKGENVIYMTNHQCAVDWLIVDSVAIRQGCVGTIRYILKDSLKYIPLYGYYFEQHGCIYVKRRATQDRVKMARSLETIRDRKTPVWMVVFPEGTRYDVSKPHLMEKSQQYARDQGLDVLSQLLAPKTKAMQACFDNLSHHYDAIYDVTVAYCSKRGGWKRHSAPSMLDFLGSRCRSVHIHVKRFSCDEIPEDTEEQAKWVQDRFLQKDRLLNRFYSPDKSQSFDDSGGCYRPVPNYLTWPSFLLIACTFIPLFGTAQGRMLYVSTALVCSMGTSLLMAFR